MRCPRTFFLEKRDEECYAQDKFYEALTSKKEIVYYEENNSCAVSYNGTCPSGSR